MEFVSRFKDESVTFTHEAVRTRMCLSSLKDLILDIFYLAPAVYDRYQYGVNLPYNMIVTGDSVMKINPVYG